MALILGTSAWTGFGAAAHVRQSVQQLRQLQLSLSLMRSEIECRLTPLRKLSDMLAQACQGELSRFYAAIADAMLHGASAAEAYAIARRQCRRLHLPQPVVQSLDALFATFGQYDYTGQLRCIDLAGAQTDAALAQLSGEQQSRSRCYALLGVCTGLALVILVA